MPAPPAPIKEASETLIKRQIQEFITEHFGFAPESFTARAVDLANDVIYNTMDQIEKVVHDRLGSNDSIELVEFLSAARKHAEDALTNACGK
jgi:Mis12 protein